MSIELRREYIRRLKKRYQKSRKHQKTKILDEFCQVAEYSRKYAIRILSSTEEWQPVIRRGRQAKYNAAVVWHLRQIWEAMDYCGSKTMVGNLPEWIEYYFAEGFSEKIKALLLEISPATVDRLLKPYRMRLKKGLSTTTSKNLLKGKVPIKMLGKKPEKPGYVEVDTVAHCGPTAFGVFANTLTVTDLHSGWTENRASMGKKELDVLELIREIERDLPFGLLGVSSDNGNEFLNWSMVEYLRQRQYPVEFVRTRAYKKNDNAHVEQKNWTHVRQVFGYERIDSELLVPLMNKIYKELWNPYRNYFFVCRKLVSKSRVGGKVRKNYDQLKTPYQRLIESPDVAVEMKQFLQAQRAQINPFALKRELNKALSRFQSHLNKLNKRWRVA